MDAPTMDEQNHIARGLAFVRTGEPRLSLEHPPLINAWSALPLLSLNGIDLPLDDPSWQREPPQTYWYDFATRLFWEINAPRVPTMVFMARVPIILLTLLLAAVVQRFGSLLWHNKAGFVAAGLTLFDPNIIAHGRYSTTDMAGTFGLTMMAFGLWGLFAKIRSGQVDQKSRAVSLLWRQEAILFAAICMGIAFGSKLSMLGFVPIFAIVSLLPIFPDWSWHTALRRLGLYLTAGVLSIGVVWAIFGFEWGNFWFLDEQFAWLNQYSAPMPTFWAGIERIMVATGGGRPTYLLGEFYDTGVPLYFPIAFLVKTPIVTLLLLIVAMLTLLANKVTRGRAFYLLIPALFYFGTTTQSGLNIGYRHLLPILPLVYLLISGITPRHFRQEGVTSRRGFVLLLAVIAAVVTTVRVYPHYVGYFNLTVGQENGWEVLHDSNIDWGQDLVRLRTWMDENGIERVKLSYFGSADPTLYLNYDPLPGNPRHLDLWTEPPFDITNPESGVYAISVQSLIGVVGQPWTHDRFAFFRAREPDIRIGGIWVYVLE